MRQFILGTDWWTDCDDAVALRLLCRAVRHGQIRLLGIGINACMEHSVSSLHGFLCSEGVQDIPLALDREATDFGGNPPYQKRLAALSDGSVTNQTAEHPVALYRRLLATASEPVEIIEIGYPQMLAAVLQSGADEYSPLSGVELFRQKVSKVWMMAGKWDEDPGLENNFKRNTRSAQGGAAVCSLCPVPITFLGFEAGETVLTGGQLAADDPLHLALSDHGSGEGRSSWDPMLVQLALEGDEHTAGYEVCRGTATVCPQSGQNRFLPDGNGLHCYVIKQKPDGYYREKIDQNIRRECY